MNQFLKTETAADDRATRVALRLAAHQRLERDEQLLLARRVALRPFVTLCEYTAEETTICASGDAIFVYVRCTIRDFISSAMVIKMHQSPRDVNLDLSVVDGYLGQADLIRAEHALLTEGYLR